MLPAAAMKPMTHFCRIAAGLLAAAVAGCVKPPVPVVATAAAVPAAVAPAPERLDLALRNGGVSWQAAAGGALPGGGDMQEYVPAGETVADWKQMITTLTLPRGQDPQARLTEILDGLRGACKSYRVMRASATQNPNSSNDTLVRCDRPDEAVFSDPNILLLRHEVIWAKTVHGRAQNYVIWRAWHGDAITPDSVLASAAVRREWQDWLDQVSLVGGAS